MRLCFCYNHPPNLSAKENDVKTTDQPQENSENDTDAEKPSECKIAKTEVEETEEPTKEPQPPSETIEVKVIYNKNKYHVNASSDTTVADFKKQLQELLGIGRF